MSSSGPLSPLRESNLREEFWELKSQKRTRADAITQLQNPPPTNNFLDSAVCSDPPASSLFSPSDTSVCSDTLHCSDAPNCSDTPNCSDKNCCLFFMTKYHLISQKFSHSSLTLKDSLLVYYYIMSTYYFLLLCGSKWRKTHLYSSIQQRTLKYFV